MDFASKLKRLSEGKNRAAIARAAALKPAIVNNYIYRGSQPMAHAALALARALSVPFDWLVDDGQDWPPPPASTAAALSTEQLATELGRRLSGIGSSLLLKLIRAEAIDWAATAMELLRADLAQPIPKHLREAAELARQIDALASELRQFDPRAPVGDAVSREARESLATDANLTLLDLSRRCIALERVPGYLQTYRFSALWMLPQETRNNRGDDFFVVARLKAAQEVGAGVRFDEAMRTAGQIPSPEPSDTNIPTP